MLRERQAGYNSQPSQLIPHEISLHMQYLRYAGAQGSRTGATKAMAVDLPAEDLGQLLVPCVPQPSEQLARYCHDPLRRVIHKYRWKPRLRPSCRLWTEHEQFQERHKRPQSWQRQPSSVFGLTHTKSPRLCNFRAISVQSRCNLCAITVQSLCNHCAISV